MRLLRIRGQRQNRNRFLPAYQATNTTYRFFPLKGSTHSIRWAHLLWPQPKEWSKPVQKDGWAILSTALRNPSAGGRQHLAPSGLGLAPRSLNFRRTVGPLLRRATHLKRTLTHQQLLHTLAYRRLRRGVRE